MPIHARIGRDGDEDCVKVGSRSYLHAQNLADAILFLLRRNTVNTPQTADRPQLTADLIGKPLRHEYIAMSTARAGHDGRYQLNGSKVTDSGWTPPYSFQDSLKREVEWTLDRPLWAQRKSGDGHTTRLGLHTMTYTKTKKEL